MVYIAELVSLASSLLKVSLSKLSKALDVSVPATMLPLTFKAVLPMSMSASTEISIPARATGKFSEERTIKAANVAPPPTPAIPNELIPIIKTSGTIKLIVKGSMPTVGAIMTASMAG